GACSRVRIVSSAPSSASPFFAKPPIYSLSHPVYSWLREGPGDSPSFLQSPLNSPWLLTTIEYPSMVCTGCVSSVTYKARAARRPQHRGPRLRLECLEDRTMLSVQFTPGPYGAPGGGSDTPLGETDRSRPMEPFL